MRPTRQFVINLVLFTVTAIAAVFGSATSSRAALWGQYYVPNDSFGECWDRRLTPDTRIGKCASALRIPELNRRGVDDVFELLADAYLNEYDYQSAIKVYDRAMKTARDQDMGWFHYLRGLAFEAWGKSDFATAEFAEAAKANHEDYADAGLAQIAMDQGQFDKAIELYSKALAIGDAEYSEMADLAYGYARRGDYESAMKIDDELIADLHFSSFPFNERCWQRASLNRDIDLALADCNKALDLLPDDPAELDSRGFVYFRQGRFDDAIADYKAALSHNPRYASSLFMLGVVEIRKGDARGGNAHIAAAEAIYPRIGADYAEIGVVP